VLYRTTLPPEASSVPIARHWAAELATASGCNSDTVGTVALVVTELASNAVKHAASEFTLELDMTLPDEDATRPIDVRIAVSDEDSRLPRIENIDDGALGGRGLWLVRSLAEGFGVDGTEDGKTVWAVLVDLDAPYPDGPHRLQDRVVPAQSTQQ
jgi:two-component sensor histidine kinase